MSIHKLSQDTINKIAAGEVVQRPSNGLYLCYSAIKELIENSIDAESTSISISITQGGLKELRVSDNGKGIAKQDLPLVCERFATSKIRSYEDLINIGSFGFRGEALASLSYVSDVTVVSKQRSSDMAYSAEYKDGRMTTTPEAHHLSSGMVITSRKLFNSLAVRRESLKAGEEKRRVIKIISVFALHYSSVRFRLMCDGKVELTTEHNAGNQPDSQLSIFSKLYETSINDIFRAETELDTHTKLSSILTKPKISKGKTLILLVNNRIVQIQEIFNAIDEAYTTCYKSIHVQDITFTAYISLTLEPKMIDCNVHPTKRVVHIVNCAYLCQKLTKWVLGVLKKQCKIVPFYGEQQTLIIRKVEQLGKVTAIGGQGSKQAARTRTDSKQIPMRYYLPELSQRIEGDIPKEPQLTITYNETTQQNLEKTLVTDLEYGNRHFIGRNTYTFKAEEENQQPCVIVPSETQSMNLRCSIENPSDEIRQFFRNMVYVGCVNSNFILVQLEEALRMMNILPFMPALLMVWFRKEPRLYIRRLEPSVAIDDLLKAFSQESGKSFDFKCIREALLKSRTQIWQILRLYINTQGQVTHTCVPLPFMGEKMYPVELGYMLARTSKYLNQNMSINEEVLHGYLIDYLSTLFEDKTAEYQPSSRYFDGWFRDRLLPLAKLKGEFPHIDTQKYLLEMLHLKQVYKVFERC